MPNRDGRGADRAALSDGTEGKPSTSLKTRVREPCVMYYQFQSGLTMRGRSRSKSRGQEEKFLTLTQPEPLTPGITRQMVRDHARRLFRDQWRQQPLSRKQWQLAEQDLVRMLEADAL